MAAVLEIFFLLLIICCASGYGIVRVFGKGLPTDSRLAVLPLAGAAVLGVVLQLLHLFQPLGRTAVFIALIPAFAGAVLFVLDIFRGRLPLRRSFPGVVFVAIAIGCVLTPFWELRRPTTFGIINNDGFYYSTVDYLVQNTGYTEKESPSRLVKAASLIRRFGLNYLSTVAQTLSRSRSWETVHLSGAFGLLLSVAAGYLLTRGLGGGPIVAAVAGLLMAMNHWVFRLYMEAILAFLFGYAFLVGSLWACTLRDLPKMSRVGLAGLMVCGLTVFYFDLLLIFAVLAVALAATGLAFRQKLAFPVPAILALAILPAAVLREVVSHFLLVSAATGPGKHLNLQDMPRTVLHLAGMMDVYDYMYWPGQITPLHVAGTAAVVLLGLYALRNVRRCTMAAAFFLGVVAPLLGLALLLFYQGRDYHAHRALTLAAGCAIPPLAVLIAGVGTLTRRAATIRTAIVAVALLGVAQAVWRIVDRFHQQNLMVTDFEKQIGDRWIPTLDQGAVVLIDLAQATPFQSHYLYLETVYGFGGDESRVILPPVAGSYLAAPPLAAQELSRATHVLRLRNTPARFGGVLQPVAANERYELLTVAGARSD